MNMADRLLVSTRKGLFSLARRGECDWQIERVSFLGDAVSLALYDPRDGALYAALGLGHFGVKLWRSPGLCTRRGGDASRAFSAPPEGGGGAPPPVRSQHGR